MGVSGVISAPPNLTVLHERVQVQGHMCLCVMCMCEYICMCVVCVDVFIYVCMYSHPSVSGLQDYLVDTKICK